MAVLLISSEPRMKAWSVDIPAALPGEDIRTWPDYGAAEDIEIAIMGDPDTALFAKCPNLKLVIAQRAGVEDHVEALRDFPAIRLCRAQLPDGDAMLNEYALLCTLYHHRNMPDFLAANEAAEWVNPGVKFVADRTVGVMGLGVIGLGIARYLRDAGFKVLTWTRSGSDEAGMEHFSGADTLGEFLSRSEILMNVLALTEATENIIDADFLARLPKGAALINLGRGEQIVDADLIAAVDAGHIDSATLDVFRQEPLPADHPFWAHKRILVMPHTARRPPADALTPQLIENIRRYRAGEDLLQPVDIDRGY